MQGGQMHVKVYNADRSEAEQGGNAIRIFAHYLKSTGEVKRESFSLTKSGEVEIRFLKPGRNPDSNDYGTAFL